MREEIRFAVTLGFAVFLMGQADAQVIKKGPENGPRNEGPRYPGVPDVGRGGGNFNPPPGTAGPAQSAQDVINNSSDEIKNYSPLDPTGEHGLPRPRAERVIPTFERCHINDPVRKPNAGQVGKRGVEDTYGKKLTFNERAKLYRQQAVPGQRRDFYLSDDEYDQYTDGFLHLKANDPTAYEDAVNARTEWNNDTFRPTFFDIYTATANVHVEVSDDGDFTLTFPAGTQKDLLVKKIDRFFIDRAKGGTLELALGKEMGGNVNVALTHAEALYMLYSEHRTEEKREWLHKQATPEEVHDIAVRLVIKDWAEEHSKDTLYEAPQREFYLQQSFDQTEERLQKYEGYKERERSFHPKPKNGELPNGNRQQYFQAEPENKERL